MSVYFGGNPFFPWKRGHGPLFGGSSPHLEEKRVSRQTLKSSHQILKCSKYRPKYQQTSNSIWYINTNTSQAASIKTVSNSKNKLHCFIHQLVDCCLYSATATTTVTNTVTITAADAATATHHSCHKSCCRHCRHLHCNHHPEEGNVWVIWHLLAAAGEDG